MEMENELCKKEHERVDEILSEHGSKIDNHETRIGALEREQSVMSNELKHLNKNLKSLTAVLWALVFFGFTTLAGFLINYIQTIPR